MIVSSVRQQIGQTFGLVHAQSSAPGGWTGHAGAPKPPQFGLMPADKVKALVDLSTDDFELIPNPIPRKKPWVDVKVSAGLIDRLAKTYQANGGLVAMEKVVPTIQAKLDQAKLGYEDVPKLFRRFTLAVMEGLRPKLAALEQYDPYFEQAALAYAKAQGQVFSSPSQVYALLNSNTFAPNRWSSPIAIPWFEREPLSLFPQRPSRRSPILSIGERLTRLLDTHLTRFQQPDPSTDQDTSGLLSMVQQFAAQWRTDAEQQQQQPLSAFPRQFHMKVAYDADRRATNPQTSHIHKGHYDPIAYDVIGVMDGPFTGIAPGKHNRLVLDADEVKTSRGGHLPSDFGYFSRYVLPEEEQQFGIEFNSQEGSLVLHDRHRFLHWTEGEGGANRNNWMDIRPYRHRQEGDQTRTPYGFFGFYIPKPDQAQLTEASVYAQQRRLFVSGAPK